MLRHGSSVFGIVLLLASGTASAECLQPNPVRVCTEYFHSEDVLAGKITAMRKIPNTPDPNNVEGWFYKVAIAKTYRGSAKGTIEVYTGNDETKFPMEVGHTYLLFVNKNMQGRMAPDVCGNSAETDTAADALKAIEQIAKDSAGSAGADIGGRVVLPVPGSLAMSDSGAPGIPIDAHSFIGTDAKATTDKEGRFHIHVPAGHYSVTGTSEQWDIVPYTLSYMKPADFEIADGGCADLMLLAQPK